MRYKANITDILRCLQKDDQFSQLYANELVNIVRLCGNKYQKFTKNMYPTTQALYYWSTSLSKLQTLGEEYTGILRVNKTLNNLPNNTILWFLLYIGGERIFLKILHYMHVSITKNSSFTSEAQSSLLQVIKSIENNKDIIYKCHQTAFYLNGKFYSISNRIAGIRYMCLRDWMADDYYSKAFSVLGRIYFLYLLCSIVYKLYNTYQQSSRLIENDTISTYSSRTGENCFLCDEVKVNPCALTCSHIFCWNCIFNIISHDRKCPICREIVYSSRVILLQNY